MSEEVCVWTPFSGDREGHYDTSCGKAFVLTDGDLADNDFNYCAFCGGKIEVAQGEDENYE